MSLNESIVEDAALKWFGELGYAVKSKWGQILTFHIGPPAG